MRSGSGEERLQVPVAVDDAAFKRVRREIKRVGKMLLEKSVPPLPPREPGDHAMGGGFDEPVRHGCLRGADAEVTIGPPTVRAFAFST